MGRTARARDAPGADASPPRPRGARRLRLLRRSALVFDLDGFDEAAWAPWEWGLTRLAPLRLTPRRARARRATASLSRAAP
ncbi:DUF2252 family protein [Microbacterium sp. BWT-B31]|uniref:DUF2252 family protein n=1 Tax=Microbacterium sp. BWT-B31 TaxID=3232072 RepID=UPI003529398D